MSAAILTAPTAPTAPSTDPSPGSSAGSSATHRPRITSPTAGAWISARGGLTTTLVSFVIHLPALSSRDGGQDDGGTDVKITFDEATDTIARLRYSFIVAPWHYPGERAIDTVMRIIGDACALALADAACEGALGNAIARVRALLPALTQDPA